MQIVKEEYERKGAIRGLHQPVEFESETITLNIPMEGMSTKGWTITALGAPVVSSCESLKPHLHLANRFKTNPD